MICSNEMIRQAGREDSSLLASFGVQVFSGSASEDLEKEFAELAEQEDAACFIKYIGETPVGFAQCGLRHDYVEGTKTSPVGYLEGIFVLPQYRGRDYGAELLSSCENWAREKGCTEFASDCGLSNYDSLSFHLAVGFEEANRIICFRKTI